MSLVVYVTLLCCISLPVVGVIFLHVQLCTVSKRVPVTNSLVTTMFSKCSVRFNETTHFLCTCTELNSFVLLVRYSTLACTPFSVE